MEEQRSFNVRNVERNIVDSVGHGATHHPTKTHRKEDGKVTENETVKEPRKVESPKEEKADTKGKEMVKGKKGQRLNEITEPPEEQWTAGSWDQWPEQSWNTEADTASWRDDWHTTDSKCQTSAAAEEFQHASIGDLRLSNFQFCQTNTLNLFNLTDRIFHSELSHLVLIPLHVLYLDVRTALQAETKFSCTLDRTGKPMAIESRKVNCRRPLMSVTEMTDCRRWVCSGPQRQGFS